MTRRLRGASPRLKARIAGILYVLIFIAAPTGAATATATKMLVTLSCDTAIAFIFYGLFKPVSRSLSLLAAVSRLVFVVILGTASLNYLSPLVLLNGHRSPDAFNRADALSMVPFGFHCILIAYLIFRSNFLPRFLGVLMALAGLAYLTFLNPQFGSRLFFPYLAIPGVLGEGSLTLWLLIMGVNVRRWKEQASLATVRS
jgi:hypothetical protein